MDYTIKAMRADIEKERELLRVRETVIAALATLPNDDSRRRVIRAAALLMDIEL